MCQKDAESPSAARLAPVLDLITGSNYVTLTVLVSLRSSVSLSPSVSV